MSRDSRKNRKSLDKIICEIWAEQPIYFPSTRIKTVSKHEASYESKGRSLGTLLF